MKVTCKDNNNEIPSFIYTSAHVRDLDAIKIMAGELATFERNSNQLDPRDPSYMELEGWEFLREPIDYDIDEGDYVQEGSSMVNPMKRRMMRIKYQKIGKTKMRK